MLQSRKIPVRKDGIRVYMEIQKWQGKQSRERDAERRAVTVGTFSAICVVELGESEIGANLKMETVANEEKRSRTVDYKNSEISVAIDEYIHNERDRNILKRRLIDGICYEPLAEEFDMSVRQIKTIVYKGEQKIIKYLK